MLSIAIFMFVEKYVFYRDEDYHAHLRGHMYPLIMIGVIALGYIIERLEH